MDFPHPHFSFSIELPFRLGTTRCESLLTLLSHLLALSPRQSDLHMTHDNCQYFGRAQLTAVTHVDVVVVGVVAVA